jgi:hypothetical protein
MKQKTQNVPKHSKQGSQLGPGVKNSFAATRKPTYKIS